MSRADFALEFADYFPHGHVEVLSNGFLHITFTHLIIWSQLKPFVIHYLFNLFDAADELKHQEEDDQFEEARDEDDHNTGLVIKNKTSTNTVLAIR